MKRLRTMSKSIITMCPTPAPARYGRTADASPPAPITKQVLPSRFLGNPGQNKTKQAGKEKGSMKTKTNTQNTTTHRRQHKQPQN